MTNYRIYGYFTDAGQTEPAYDPGLDVNCPVCQQRLAAPVKTISVRADDARSYFYRVHKACHEGLTEAQESDLDGLIVDAIWAAQNVN